MRMALGPRQASRLNRISFIIDGEGLTNIQGFMHRRIFTLYDIVEGKRSAYMGILTLQKARLGKMDSSLYRILMYRDSYRYK